VELDCIVCVWANCLKVDSIGLGGGKLYGTGLYRFGVGKLFGTGL
jgi:hypothetical protein